MLASVSQAPVAVAQLESLGCYTFMKTHIIIIVAAMLAVGCSHKPDARDAKIAKLETRVTASVCNRTPHARRA
jgi:hypothetical protein